MKRMLDVFKEKLHKEEKEGRRGGSNSALGLVLILHWELERIWEWVVMYFSCGAKYREMCITKSNKEKKKLKSNRREKNTNSFNW